MKTVILKPTKDSISLCAEQLKSGELIGLPTETVYGLAGLALAPESLAKIFEAKSRPTMDPLIVHVALETPSTAALMKEKLIDPKELSDAAVKKIDRLIRKFWPGPLTLVLPKSSLVPDLATSGLPTVAIRMPAHPVALELIRAVGSPLCAPSANQFGKISPTSAADVKKELDGKIPSILDGGECERGIESTIILVDEDAEVFCLRPGSLALEEIEAALDGEKIRMKALDSSQGPLKAPGMLKSHYAPKTPLMVLEHRLDRLTTLPQIPQTAKKIGVLVMEGNLQQAENLAEAMFDHAVEVRSLSRDGESNEMARNFFRALRELDECGADLILSEPIPNGTGGLLYALRDRLKKASTPAKAG